MRCPRIYESIDAVPCLLYDRLQGQEVIFPTSAPDLIRHVLSCSAFSPLKSSIISIQQHPRTTQPRLSLTCVLVLWPRTGSPIACRLPLYVPISFNRFMFSCTSLLASFSIFIFVNSAVRSRTVAFLRLPTLAKGWMWNRAMTRCDTLGPMP